jgi:hypothetical protein
LNAIVICFVALEGVDVVGRYLRGDFDGVYVIIRIVHDQRQWNSHMVVDGGNSYVSGAVSCAIEERNKKEESEETHDFIVQL